ncbi:unnamed protein product [Peniophora sp. CBMAI 1063]|nr:unnamed protein product [Peniophora sp. CBMAI 1063]
MPTPRLDLPPPPSTILFSAVYPKMGAYARTSGDLLSDLQLAIARAEMELAEKRLALLMAQGSPALNASQINGASALGDLEVEPGRVEDNAPGGEPGEASVHESHDTADVTEVLQSTRDSSVAEDANSLPPVTTAHHELAQVLDDAAGGAHTDDNDDDAHSAAVPDENDEVEDLVRDSDADADADMSPVTVKIEADKAETSSAPTNGDDEDVLPIGPFIDRVLRWAGLVWSDAETRSGVDFDAAADLATEMMGFEIVSVRGAQVACRAPLDIRSAKQWASKQRMASKIYATVPEPNYTQLVAQAWRHIREQPFEDVKKMSGRYGLIGVVRAIYQANAVDSDKHEDFRVVMLDAADALRAMRATIGLARDAQPGPVAAPTATASSTLLQVLTQRNAEQAAQATEVLDRMSNGDIIEIESDDEEPVHGSRKGGSGSGGGKARNVPAKRKPTSAPGPPSKPKKHRL